MPRKETSDRPDFRRNRRAKGPSLGVRIIVSLVVAAAVGWTFFSIIS